MVVILPNYNTNVIIYTLQMTVVAITVTNSEI